MATKQKHLSRKKPATLKPLRAERDVKMWETLLDMERRGLINGQMPDYELIAKELVAHGGPQLERQQISQVIVRLKNLGYIKETIELAKRKQVPVMAWVAA